MLTSVSSTGSNKARVPAGRSAGGSVALGSSCCAGGAIAPSLCSVTLAMTG